MNDPALLLLLALFLSVCAVVALGLRRMVFADVKRAPRLSGAVAASAVPMIECDATGRGIGANGAFLALTGAGLAACEGYGWHVVLDDDVRGEVVSEFRRAVERCEAFDALVRVNVAGRGAVPALLVAVPTEAGYLVSLHVEAR